MGAESSKLGCGGSGPPRGGPSLDGGEAKEEGERVKEEEEEPEPEWLTALGCRPINGPHRKPLLSDVVMVDVRGEVFCMSRSHFTVIPGTFLACMFSGRYILPTDDKGCVTMDFNPVLFRRIMKIHDVVRSRSGPAHPSIINDPEWFNWLPQDAAIEMDFEEMLEFMRIRNALEAQWAKAMDKMEREMKVGVRLDALDKDGTWWEATVVALFWRGEERMVKVHFRAWHSRYDEIIPLEADRLAPLHAFTTDLRPTIAIGSQVEVRHDSATGSKWQRATVTERQGGQVKVKTVPGAQPLPAYYDMQSDAITFLGHHCKTPGLPSSS